MFPKSQEFSITSIVTKGAVESHYRLPLFALISPSVTWDGASF